MIECNDLGRRFGTVRAVDAVSFAVSGDVVILGPSGSGKSTLLRLIAGLEIPDTGTIALDGAVVSQAGWALSPHRRNISCMFQMPALWPHMTVAENVRFAMGASRNGSADRLDALLEGAAITPLADRYPREISGGEARRVALVRALAREAQYLLLDEPLLNLNRELKDRMFDLLQEEQRRTGAVLVYITHDLEEADQIPATVLRMAGGRLVEGPE
ncbi:MAG: ATP-binding cassette domain-containing protein [Methanomicrobiaceae archaeon]|nr:ATP-binding cassette domain-containing protein [Methanomicrobiaceae archaeon]